MEASGRDALMTTLGASQDGYGRQVIGEAHPQKLLDYGSRLGYGADISSQLELDPTHLNWCQEPNQVKVKYVDSLLMALLCCSRDSLHLMLYF